ncbi:MAG: hypothetical protein M8353_00065 [ANME-2 cluster archaeon]|nr:hypothetical protein [ANME-2 cluster archaeon]
MIDQEIWFSHREEIYEVKNGKFIWTNKEKIWNWDHCTIRLVRKSDKKLRVVVRSNTNLNSKYMGDKPTKLRYMLGFDINDVRKPLNQMPQNEWDGPANGEFWNGPKARWVFFLIADGARTSDEDAYCIWQLANNGEPLESSYLYSLYEEMLYELTAGNTSDNIFHVHDVDQDEPHDAVVPIIYQPAVDSMKNFLREIHCVHKPLEVGGYEVEVNLIFNNEQLRKHSLLHKSYEWMRVNVLYGRRQDIESFRILGGKEPTDFVFKGIYSKKNGTEYGLEHDDIHGDTVGTKIHGIKYYFMNKNHPVVFVNTSNHAVAEDDANHRLWKWEYVPWENDGPVVSGNKSRAQINKEFKPRFKFW